MPETYWEITVASAAPATPRRRPATNHRSSTMFSTAETARNTRGTTEFPRERSREAKKLYRKIPASPAKITSRYSRIRDTRPSGVRSAQMIQSSPRKTARLSAAVTAPSRAKEARIPSFSPRVSFWPKRMENTVPLPIASPSRMEVRKVIREKEDPTAARASAPRNWPTITVSAML